jgi:cytochrome c oxidase assembly factor CtaG/ferredoxin
MNPALDAFLRSWPNRPWLCLFLFIAAAIYLNGWKRLRTHNPRRWTFWRLTACWGGLLAICVALASPIEVFAELLLSVHMLQHMLLIMVAPPLLWLSQPLLPILRGMPRALRSWIAIPVLQAPLARDAFAALTHPLIAGPVLVAVVWVWHAPRSYELALQDPTWHIVEHATFLAASLLFWFPVIQPYPSRLRWSRWLVLPYLVFADVQNTVLSAWLSFATEPIYRHYTEVPKFADWSPLADQQLAGVLMWVPGSIAFLLPVFVIGIRILDGRSFTERNRNVSRILPALPIAQYSHSAEHVAAQRAAPSRYDLLRAPLLGQFLRRRWARPALQAVVLIAAIVVMLDGFLGPSAGPANLAGVVPWIHWRGLLMFGLLVGGNFFCMVCPFTLPRRAAGRWLSSRWQWPALLRSKWLAVLLTAVFLWSYEAFALWDSPWLTAWIVLAYFLAAFVVDGLFRGAAFCKYVCPIGQFNFVQSLISPLEVGIREPQACMNCQTKDCIRGNQSNLGCGTHLFQPRKVGNFDCTFCLDCVHACPHENVGVLTVAPGKSLSQLGDYRSGIGRLSRRVDIAVLIWLLVFGAFANAAGMIAPVIVWQDQVAKQFGLTQFGVITLYYLVALGIVPFFVVALAGTLSGPRGRKGGTRKLGFEFAYAFVPLGFAMWLAHHGFHFLTSYATILPVGQRAIGELIGTAVVGEPLWQHACCLGIPDWIIKFELLILGFGLLGSLAVGHRMTVDDGMDRHALLGFTPWALLMCALFALGVWIVLEPMQMRGTLPSG